MSKFLSLDLNLLFKEWRSILCSFFTLQFCDCSVSWQKLCSSQLSSRNCLFCSINFTSVGAPACAGTSQVSVEPLWYGDWQELSCAGSESSLPTPCRFTLVAPFCHCGSIYTAEIGKLCKSENLPAAVRADLLVPTRWMALLLFLLPILRSRTAMTRAQAVKNTVQLSNLNLPFQQPVPPWTSFNRPSSLTRLLSKSKQTMPTLRS